MMKRLAAAVLFVAAAQSSSWAYYRDILSDRIGFEYMPRESQQTLDSDFRLRGMGGLSLSVEDESNYLGAYKYADFAAALPMDYKIGKLELNYYHDSGTVDDNSREDTAYTGELADLGGSSAHIMGYVPFSSPWGRHGLVFRKAWDYSDYDYTGSAAGGFSPIKEEASIRDFTLAWGAQFNNNLLGGLSIEHTMDRVKDEIFTTKDDLRTDTTEISPSIGYLWNLPNDKSITFIGGPRFIRMEDKNSANISEADLDGTKVGFGALFEKKQFIKIGAFYDSGKLDGDVTVNGNNIGNEELERSKYLLRTYITPRPTGFHYGVSYEGTDRNVKDEDTTGATVTDDDAKRSTFGLGTSYNFTKGLIGLEYKYSEAELIDNLAPSVAAFNRDETGNEWNLGGEYNFTDTFAWRAGFRNKVVSSDPEGPTEKADLKYWELSTGVTFKMNQSLDLGGALTWANQEQESVPTLQDEQEAENLALQLTLRYNWGTPPPPPPAP